MPHLIVFSHLRWAFVFQRPQHLLSRLASRFPVVFVEEPVHAEGPSRLERSTPVAGVEVLRPHTRSRRGGFHDDQLSALGRSSPAISSTRGSTDYVVWFYTPMALPLLADLTPRAVVYDCMDELSAFKNAPRQMRQREAALLKRADLVTDRRAAPVRGEAAAAIPTCSACRAQSTPRTTRRAGRNSTTRPWRQRQRCKAAFRGRAWASSASSTNASTWISSPALPTPTRPGRSIMVGPVVKIDPAALPQRPNLHWLGQQAYGMLPQLVAGWDVCLMPFALQRIDRVHQPDQDARIHGRRQAGRLDANPRRASDVRRPRRDRRRPRSRSFPLAGQR